MRVALVNTNRLRPPIAPIGLDYLAEALRAAGHQVEVLDLCWSKDCDEEIARFFAGSGFGLVGLTLRNTDDCMFAGRRSFLEEFAALVRAIHQCTEAPIALGGVGFSVMPEQILSRCPADLGLWGEGEFVFPKVVDCLERGEDWRDLPGLLWNNDGRWQRNPPAFYPLDELPAMSRAWIDNLRYFREGGQAGFETKRGCPGRCLYCADPLAKGDQTRLRPPGAVADELERLLAQGIDHLHTCDSEFNLPVEHAIAVCWELVRRGLGERLRWYAYCAPAPFSPELARLMRRAGCVGINFGVDSGDAEMLARLRRNFTPDDIAAAVYACRQAGIATMLDLLLGAPGETETTLRRTIELMQRLAPERVGVSLGVRVYPKTPLAAKVQQERLSAGLIGSRDPETPLYFLEPQVAPFAENLLRQLIGDDPRFFFAPSGPERDYNYSDNERLTEAIRQGHRGAYWDILRQSAK